MATISTTSGAGASANNNRGTIVNAGYVDSAGTTNAPGFGVVIGAGSNGPVGPTEQSGTVRGSSTDSKGFSKYGQGRGGRQTAKGSGTFAYNNQRGVIRRVNTLINGVSNTTLQSGGVGVGARANSSIGGLESFRTLPQSGFTADGSIKTLDSAGGTLTNYVDPAVSGGATASNDSAANPTRAIPGELVYTATSLARSGSLAVPKQDDYKEKTG
jgi:hypothetical protein